MMVRGEHRWAGPVKDVRAVYTKLTPDERACATINTETRAYFGKEIEEELLKVS